MGSVNVNLLKAKLIERSMNVEMLAERMHMQKSTLYRKLQNRGAGILVSEAKAITKILQLSPHDAVMIFFAEAVA